MKKMHIFVLLEMRRGSEKRRAEGNKRGTGKPATLAPYLKHKTPQACRITRERKVDGIKEGLNGNFQFLKMTLS